MGAPDWDNQVVPNVTIVGPNGQIYVYSPTIGLGNLVYSVSSHNTTDTVGNAVLAGSVSYFKSSGVYFALQHTAASIISYRATTEAGPWVLKTEIDFTLINADGTGTINVATGSFQSTGGTVTDPTIITTDIWNQVTPGGTWTNSGSGVNGFFYTLLPDGNVLLAWDVANNNANPGTLGTLPAAYRPATTVRLASGWTGTGPTSYNDQFAPALEVHTDGTIHGDGLFVATLTLFGTAILPLGSL